MVGISPDNGLLLDLPLHAARSLPPHDPDGVPGLHVVVVDEVAGAHHPRTTPTLGAVHCYCLTTTIINLISRTTTIIITTQTLSAKHCYCRTTSSINQEQQPTSTSSIIPTKTNRSTSTRKTTTTQS